MKYVLTDKNSKKKFEFTEETVASLLIYESRFTVLGFKMLGDKRWYGTSCCVCHWHSDS